MENKLKIFTELLLKWQKSINLISDSTKDDILNRHIKNSQELVKYIPKNKIIFDLGSGAGFPGIVLGIFGYKVFCIESDLRKCLFLKEVKRKLNLNNINILNERIEKIVNKNSVISCEIKNNSSGIVVARGFASLLKIFNMTKNLNFDYYLLKGKNYQVEIDESLKKYDFNYEVFDSNFGDGVILIIKNLCEKK